MILLFTIFCGTFITIKIFVYLLISCYIYYHSNSSNSSNHKQPSLEFKNKLAHGIHTLYSCRYHLQRQKREYNKLWIQYQKLKQQLQQKELENLQQQKQRERIALIIWKQKQNEQNFQQQDTRYVKIIP